MNEILIKNLVKYKLNVADSIINCLPAKMSEDLKSLDKIILDSANESLQDIKEQPVKKTKPENKLQNVEIE
jgi:hypothetical protein